MSDQRNGLPVGVCWAQAVRAADPLAVPCLRLRAPTARRDPAWRYAFQGARFHARQHPLEGRVRGSLVPLRPAVERAAQKLPLLWRPSLGGRFRVPAARLARHLGPHQQRQHPDLRLRYVRLGLAQILARALHPASERETYRWLRDDSALPELLGCPPGEVALDDLYRVADSLWHHCMLV